MALLDNRIESRKDCILGIARGNLAYSRFMFTVYPQQQGGDSHNLPNMQELLTLLRGKSIFSSILRHYSHASTHIGEASSSNISRSMRVMSQND
ncbi:reverse transcriptase domain-containing protein [Tanacetum coccineum]